MSIKNKIIAAMNIISDCANKNTIAFISKKAQMYTMFCLAFRLIDDNIELDEKINNKITLFIRAYNLFRNEYDLVFDDPLMNSESKKPLQQRDFGTSMEVEHDVCRFCEIVMVSTNAAWEQSSCRGNCGGHNR